MKVSRQGTAAALVATGIAVLLLLLFGNRLLPWSSPSGDKRVDDTGARITHDEDKAENQEPTTPAIALDGSLDREKKTSLTGWGAFPEGDDWEPAVVEDTDITVPYFDKQKPLRILTNRVAVFAQPDDDTDAHEERIQSALRQKGFQHGDSESQAIKGWAVATTENILSPKQGLEAVTQIQELARDLAAEDTGLNFVSPVFVDTETGALVIMTPTILLGFEKSVPASERKAVLQDVEEVATAVETNQLDIMAPYLKITLATIRSASDVIAIAQDLALRKGIRYAEPNVITETKTTHVPNDQLFANSWGLRNTGLNNGSAGFDMDAVLAWDVTIGSSDIRVIVFDSGVQQNHPDINQVAGEDFTSEKASNPDGGPVNEFDNHGTTVASCISSTIDNTIGTTGIAPGAQVVSGRILITSNDQGAGTIQSSWLVDGLNWADAQGIEISNSSIEIGSPSAAIDSAYSDTRANGMIHFAATGNDGASSISYPSSVDSVIAVGASNREGNRADFSNRGTGIAFLAPGEAILTADRTGADGYSSGDYNSNSDGTSYASPYAAGVAALILSVNPSLTPAQVQSIMESTCEPMGGQQGYSTTYGYGHINAFKALENAYTEDPYEENDTRQTATDRNFDGKWLSELDGRAVAKDDDWYKITVRDGYPLVVVHADWASIYNQYPPTIALVNSSGTTLTSNSAGDGRILSYQVPSPGTYYIVVYPNQFVDQIYDLKWEGLPPLSIDISDLGSSFHNLSQSTFLEGNTTFFDADFGVGNYGYNETGVFHINFRLYRSDFTPMTGAGGNFDSGLYGEGFWADSLNARDFRAYTKSLAIRDTLPPGTYYLAITLDSFESVQETIEDNNLIILRDHPITVVPQSLSLSETIKYFDHNGGTHSFTITSNADWTWFKQSPGAGIDDTWLTSSEASPQTGDQTFTFEVAPNPDFRERGITFIFRSGANNELIERFNVEQSGIPRTYDMSDTGTDNHNLSPLNVMRASSGPVTIQHSTSNGGNSETGGFPVRYYASVDNTIDSGDILLGEGTVSTIAAGSTVASSFSFSPANLPPGSYFIGWILDPDNQIAETDETNNTAYIPSQSKLTVEDATLTLSDTEKIFTAGQGTFGLSVISNSSWTWQVSANSDWVFTSEPSSQQGIQMFTYSVEPNVTATARTAYIDFSNQFYTVRHSITQEGELTLDKWLEDYPEANPQGLTRLELLNLDWDADGLTTVEEFAFGGIPTIRDALQVLPRLVDSGRTLQFFRRNHQVHYIILGGATMNRQDWEVLDIDPGETGSFVNIHIDGWDTDNRVFAEVIVELD